jgi:hypothetical protein
MSAVAADFAKTRFWRHTLIYTFACVGALSGLIQILIVFFPTLANHNGGVSFSIYVLVSVAFGVLKAWPRPIAEEFSAPKMSIVIEEGDILNEKGNVVIGMCDTFDTAMPMIAKDSLQGQALAKFYQQDLKRFDDDIDKALAGKTPTGPISKLGKQVQYEIGTVLPVAHGARILYLLAYCEMDAANKAHATVDGVWKSLLSLWSEVCKTSNGTAVSVPVIGGGQAKLSSIMPAQDSIRFIILSFVFASRKERICDSLRIVVHPNDFRKLDRLELQSFLSSLKPS